MLSALAAAVLAAVRPTLFGTVAGAAVGFVVAAMLLGPARFPPPAAVGVAVAVAAWTALLRPSWSAVSAAAGGVFAGVWLAVLRGEGLPLLAALPIAAAIPAASLVLTGRRVGFAPQQLRDEGLVLVGLFGLLVAAVPQVVAGWRSAVVMTMQPLAAEPVTRAAWLAGIVLACLLSGGLYSLWKRR